VLFYPRRQSSIRPKRTTGLISGLQDYLGHEFLPGCLWKVLCRRLYRVIAAQDEIAVETVGRCGNSAVALVDCLACPVGPGIALADHLQTLTSLLHERRQQQTSTQDSESSSSDSEAAFGTARREIHLRPTLSGIGKPHTDCQDAGKNPGSASTLTAFRTSSPISDLWRPRRNDGGRRGNTRSTANDLRPRRIL